MIERCMRRVYSVAPAAAWQRRTRIGQSRDLVATTTALAVVRAADECPS